MTVLGPPWIGSKQTMGSGRFSSLQEKGGITPLDVADLVFWLDGSDESSIAEVGGAVSQWDDKSAGANHPVQTEAALKPTFTSGEKAVNFDGSGERLEMTIFSVSGDFTMLAWASNEGTAAVRAFIGRSTNSDYVRIDFTSTDVLVRYGGSATTITCSTGYPTSGFFHMVVRRTGSLTEIFLDLVNIGSDTTSTNTWTPNRIGVSRDTAVNWDGDVAQIQIYDRALNSNEMLALKRYGDPR